MRNVRNRRNRWLAGSVLVLGASLSLTAAGCLNTAPDFSYYARETRAPANAAGQGRGLLQLRRLADRR